MRRCFECGNEKPVGDFSIGYKGLPCTECKACLALRGRIYRRTRAYRSRMAHKRLARRKKARAQYQLGGAEAARVRHARDRADDPMFAVREKLSLYIRRSVRSGRIAMPEKCARCRKGPASGYKLKVRFLTDPPTVGQVEWLCCPCHWEAVVGGDQRRAELEEERRDRADDDDRPSRSIGELLKKLTIPADEWRQIHEQHVAKVARERRPDPEHEAKAAAHLRRFRELVRHQEYRPMRHADRMLLDALTGGGARDD